MAKIWLFLFLIVSLVILGGSNNAIAEPNFTEIATTKPGTEIHVKLKNGDAIKGAFSKVENNQLFLKHKNLGEMPIAFTAISEVTDPNAAKKRIWVFKLEGGMDGSEGNSKNLNIRGSHSGERDTENSTLVYELIYKLGYARDNDTGLNKKNTNQGTFESRIEWPFKKYPKLGFYLQGNGIYDEFTDYDVRIAGYAGFSYIIFKNDNTDLTGRLGFGVSREFGGTNDVVVPEGMAGLYLQHKFTKVQQIRASTEAFPEFRDFGQYRWVNKAAYELFTSEKQNFGIGLGGEHRFDSQPGPLKTKNDWTYYASLIFKF